MRLSELRIAAFDDAHLKHTDLGEVAKAEELDRFFEGLKLGGAAILRTYHDADEILKTFQAPKSIQELDANVILVDNTFPEHPGKNVGQSIVWQLGGRELAHAPYNPEGWGPVMIGCSGYGGSPVARALGANIFDRTGGLVDVRKFEGMIEPHPANPRHHTDEEFAKMMMRISN